VIRWWPPVALAAMLLLGFAVGPGSTPLDDWFLRFGDSPARALLLFSNPVPLSLVMMFSAAVAFDSRRGRLAAIVIVAPVLTWVAAQLLKRLFGRYKDGYYAYPSGHIALTVVVMGLVVVVAGAALWSVWTTSAAVLLAIIGQSVTYHYFTDTVGALLLGSAIVCLAALVAKPRLTGVNQTGYREAEVATIGP